MDTILGKFCGRVFWAAVCLAAVAARGDESGAVKKIFANPPRQYSTSPLWVWNDMLTKDQVLSSLRDLAAQNVKQAFVHPRPGLMTPYLGSDWFRLWKATLAEAERLDMNIWIYDENSYPSGFAGGWVPELMPESRGRGLAFRETKSIGKIGPEVLGVYRLSGGGCENVTQKARSGKLGKTSEKTPDARYLVAYVRRAKNTPWNGDRCYVDLMHPGVTEKFLEVTLDAYEREIGDQFGKRVLGSFTDEPNIRPIGGLPWTDGLPQEFKKRWGYDLLDHLPSLTRPVGPWKQVRHDYFQVLMEQFIGHWAKPYRKKCEKLGIWFTGHYWDHDWPVCTGVPDNMAMYAWEHIPGIDCLMNQYHEDTHAQFGNARMVRELGSVANQLGDKRRLCEAYGAGGWDLRFEDMKRIGDWLEVLGVNFLDQHLSYVTIRGARKADHPQSFSYHEPWWDSYHVLAAYFTRQTAALCHGDQINQILVIEPTTTAWMYQADPAHAKELKEVGDTFFDLVMGLERGQVEYDIGCEDVLARHGSVEGDTLRVGRRAYVLVVLPPKTETLNAKTMDLLESYAKAGGRIIACDAPPALVDGRVSDRGRRLAQSPGWQHFPAAKLPEKLAPVLGADTFAVRRAPQDKGILFHQRRQFKDGDLVFLVNTSIESPSRGFLETRRGRSAQQWDCRTGRISPFPFSAEGGYIKVPFTLPPCGSLLVFLSTQRAEPVKIAPKKSETIAAQGPIQVRRLEPNVLTLDYMDVTAGGETKKNLYFYHANQMAFQKNGLKRNPWDSAVQFKNEIISKKFPPQSGCTATYHFTIEGSGPKPLWIVIERPDLYRITCNGTPVAVGHVSDVPRTMKSRPTKSWWLDKAFGKIDITAAAKPGENAVTIHAKPFTIYDELEPAYVLGDFSLKPAKSGFVIVPPKPLTVAKGPQHKAATAGRADAPTNAGLGWNQQGHPFYAEGVAYRETFEVPQPSGRYRVAVPSWYGSVAKVRVNGKLCGQLVSRPWECDVTKAIRPGVNTVEVIVIGTLKNTLGPHHAGAEVGRAWPAAFHQGPVQGPPPGNAYYTLSYGLFEPFVLKRIGD